MTTYTFNTNFTPFWYCGGVVLFNHDHQKVLLVETPTGNIGFTKGKREKKETLLQTAHREVEEESGYSPDEYTHDMTLIGERKSSKGPSIYLFIGTLKNKELETKGFKFDPKELAKVEWVPVETALKRLSLKRKEVLLTAINYLSQSKIIIDDKDSEKDPQKNPEKNSKKS